MHTRVILAKTNDCVSQEIGHSIFAHHEIPAEFIAWRTAFIKMVVTSNYYNKYILLKCIPVADVYILDIHGEVVNLYL